MTVNARRTNGSNADIPTFNPFASNDHFWWGYPSFAKALIDAQKALLDTQMAAVSYVEANSRLMDETRKILAREFDLSLQDRKTAGGASDASERNRPAMPGPSDVNATFESAIESWRELGEAWMDAQMRSLDAMWGQTSNGGRRHARPGPDTAE
jgi:hypothetical protein